MSLSSLGMQNLILNLYFDLNEFDSSIYLRQVRGTELYLKDPYKTPMYLQNSRFGAPNNILHKELLNRALYLYLIELLLHFSGLELPPIPTVL